MDEEQSGKITRRDFVKTAVVAGAGVALGAKLLSGEAEAAAPASKGKSMIGVPFPKTEVVRVGIIGVGGRGTGLLGDLLAIDGVEVHAICDVVTARVANGQNMTVQAGQKKPDGYAKNDYDFESLCARDDLDIVYIATPWRWHVPMAVSAMEHGHNAASEVPACFTIKDAWKLVDTSEKTGRHAMMIENCCYGYSEMLVLNMVRAGALGDVLHGEAAYDHDLRGLLFGDQGEALWRRYEHTVRNGNLYPTHGLGPVARYMDINRGDKFDRLVSFSSPERGFSIMRNKLPAGDPRRNEKYVCGDINTSLIKTALGRTIMLQHDTSSPRPYSRINMVCGTKGMFVDYPARMFIDGQPDEEWQALEKFKQYEDKLWTNIGEMARKRGGHGGMDFIMNWRLMQCFHDGLVPDMDVYDAAAWSAPGPLSEASVKEGGAPQKFPDFTRGRWKERRS